MINITRIPLAALIGIIVTSLFLLAAIFAPWIAPYGNAQIVGDVWQPMSSQFWFGTDNLGRDLLSRMIYGARITIFIAVLATALSFTLGATLGFCAAVLGGWFDTLMSRLVDLLMAIPTLIMALVVLSVLPSTLVADHGHGHTGLDARLSALAGHRRRYRGHGLRRGRKTAR